MVILLSYLLSASFVVPICFIYSHYDLPTLLKLSRCSLTARPQAGDIMIPMMIVGYPMLSLRWLVNGYWIIIQYWIFNEYWMNGSQLLLLNEDWMNIWINVTTRFSTYSGYRWCEYFYTWPILGPLWPNPKIGALLNPRISKVLAALLCKIYLNDQQECSASSKTYHVIIYNYI